MTELGSGVALDKTLDFSVGATGDLDTVSGIDELEKDLAANMIAELDKYAGAAPNQTTKATILRDAAFTALSDNRIQSVDREQSTVRRVGRREIAIDLVVTTNTNREYEFVFNI